MRTAMQDEGIAKDVGNADYASLLHWLRENIHRHGATYFPDELIKQATGTYADSDALVDHLRDRYL
mgnify:CR=1 FL=1